MINDYFAGCLARYESVVVGSVCLCSDDFVIVITKEKDVRPVL